MPIYPSNTEMGKQQRQNNVKQSINTTFRQVLGVAIFGNTKTLASQKVILVLSVGNFQNNTTNLDDKFEVDYHVYCSSLTFFVAEFSQPSEHWIISLKFLDQLTSAKC